MIMRYLRTLGTCIGSRKASLLLFFLHWVVVLWFFHSNETSSVELLHSTINLWRKHTMVTFQNGAWHVRHAGCYCDFSRWRRFGTDTPTTLFFEFLAPGTCTDRPRTHRAANHSIKKRLLRRHNKCDPMSVKKFPEKLKQLATKERFLLVFWVDGDPYKAYGSHLARH